jgi:capsular exopolysaccharide synthesis family protein
MNSALSQRVEQTTVDIKEYISILLKRKWLILICFLLSMAATTAYLFTRQPVYRATLKIAVNPLGAWTGSEEYREVRERAFLGTQLEILRGRVLMQRVQRRLRKTPEEVLQMLRRFEAVSVRGASIILIVVDSPSKDFAREFANAVAEEYLRYREEQRAQSTDTAWGMLNREVNRLSEELKAAQARFINYAQEQDTVVAGNQLAAIWNTYHLNLSRLYMLKQSLAQAQIKASVLEDSNLSAFLTLVDQNETDLRFRASLPESIWAGGGEVYGTTTETAQVSTIQSSGTEALDQIVRSITSPQPLSAADDGAGALPLPTPFISAERATNNALSTDDTNFAVASTLPAVPQRLIQNLMDLNGQRLMLVARLEEASKIYKPRHPFLLELHRQLEDVNKQIQVQMRLARDMQKAEVDFLATQVEAAEITVRELALKSMESSQATLRSTVLRDDIDRIRSQYNALLNQLMKLDVSQNINLRPVTIMEYATVEPDPVYPKKLKGLMMAAFFGLGFGLALAFFIEYVDDSIKLAEEVERDLQLPFLGMIPAAQWDPDDVRAHRLDRLKQQGGVAESYRVVRSAIIFSIPREKLRSMLITSAVPREGKTTTCVNLGISFAQIDERVLLVDGDLRRGEIHKFFSLEKEKGFSDILIGEATPESVVKQTDVPKLDVITCGSYPPNPAELLLSWRMKDFLDWAHKNYDRVIIDCTPVMGITDSAIVGSVVDGVLLVIWAGRTSRRYVRVAKMTAVSRGAKLFGFMLNNLEPGRVGYYHYYPYYYSYYSRGYYYAHREEEEKTAATETPAAPDTAAGVPTSKKQDENDIEDVY